MPNHCGHPTGDFYELEATALLFDPDDDPWDYDAFLSDYADYLLSLYGDEEALPGTSSLEVINHSGNVSS